MNTPTQLIALPDFKPHWNPLTTDEQYHSDRTSVGSGQIRKILDSPASFYEDYYGTPEPEEEPDHFRIGKMVHMAILENAKFKETYVIMPEFFGLTQDGKMSAQSKAAKDKRAAWLSDQPPHVKICEEKELKMITGIAESIMRHPQGPKLLKDCQPEVAGYFRDPETGIKIRIKPDIIKFDGSALTDFKTSRSSHSRLYANQAFDLRHDIQLYTYSEGARIINGKAPELVVSMVVEKKAPYECAFFYWAEEDLVQAKTNYRAGLTRLRKCIDENIWPYRQEQIERIYTPSWFINRSVEDEQTL